jgi:hypothetical protein
MMAAFKVGQRVRIVRSDNQLHMGAVGHEATIREVAPEPYHWLIEIHGYPRSQGWDGTGFYGASSEHLAPIADPGADAFMERIRKLKPYDEPKVERAALVTGLSRTD